MGEGLGVAPVVSATVGVAIFVLLLWAAWVSRGEGEPQAVVRLGLMAFLVPIVFLVPLFSPESFGVPLAGVVLALGLLVGLVLILPIQVGGSSELGRPIPGVDERDIMFSRATLVPGTDRFEEYYRSRPENRELDDKFRAEPGLLAPGSTFFHREGFAAADASFWTIEMLRPYVEGHTPDSGEGAGVWSGKGGSPASAGGSKLGGEPADLQGGETVPTDPEAISRFLKSWTLKMGAHSVGITELKDYHLYSHVGRGPDYGKKVDLDHTFALALTVEMDKEMVDRAPRAATAMESALQYLQGGVMAVQLADLIRRLGYRARAHVDGNYRVICPLVARDAGLGEFGRMGLIMTPTVGPRVRIAVVTTDLPLAVDLPSPDPTIVDFCLQCRKCADCCPSRAISFGPPAEDGNGVLRWRIDSEACFTLWGRMGTDCARCMAVCPYSHPDNAMHALVRRGIRHNNLFRKGALWMDDLIYGKRPPPKEELDWMKPAESTGGIPRSNS